MKIGITGASGQLGQLVITQLKQRGRGGDVVALARSPEKVRGLEVEARPADYDQPDTLGVALTGIDTLLLISSSEIGKRTAQHGNVIEAAKAAGVGRVVYTSLLRADTSDLVLAPEHRETEALLRTSGLDHTLLRNGWYMENYADGIGAAVAHGALVGAAGNGRIAAACRADFAAAAVAALSDDGHAGKVYELGGDVAFTMAELAAELSRQTGKNIPYQDLPEAEYAGILKQVGLPAPLAAAIASCDVSAAGGALDEGSKQLSSLIGRPTASLASFVTQTLSSTPSPS